jgi:hypothetical protein
VNGDNLVATTLTNGLFVTVQSQANLMNICVEWLHSKAYALSNLFGGYATSWKHVVFSTLVLNSYNFLIKFITLYRDRSETFTLRLCT